MSKVFLPPQSHDQCRFDTNCKAVAARVAAKPFAVYIPPQRGHVHAVQEQEMLPLNFSKRYGLACLPVLALAACTVAPPSGPTVVSLPGPGKTFAQFQQDDAGCRDYAQSQIAQAGQAAANAQNNSIATTAAGTLIGAAAGAALGAVGGNAGAGAAFGAGVGLLGGAAVAGGNTQATADSLQGRYDVAYAQCMVGHGESIQQPQGPGYGYGAPPPGYYAPPPGYAAPY
jgi:Glycine-zipper domain